MKKLLCLTLSLGFMTLGFSQQAKEKSALQSMVDTELAFARMAAEQGIRPSFMAFIADDGILFRPRAVKGKQWMIDHPVPASDQHPLLSWYPAVAEIAVAGDMGYTTGPWEFKNDIHDAKPVAFGNFLTVWKKQADGSWKFAADLGISTSEPTHTALPLAMQRNYKQPRVSRDVNIVSERAALFSQDRQFSSSSARIGARKSFLLYASPEIRVFRENKFPFIGNAPASQVIPVEQNLWTWQPKAADVSRSGDLGYSYGSYRLASGDAKAAAETGNYLRIWQKRGGTWKVIVDVANPVNER